MKKTLLAMLLAGSSCCVFAQVEDSVKKTMTDNTQTTTNNTQTTTDNTLTTTSEYNAYSSFTATPPVYVNSYIMRDYPAATNLHWRVDNNDWWHAYYVDANNMPMHVYYNTGGNTYTVSLPVKQSWVPDAVVTKAVQLYGPVLYDINMIKGTNRQDVYAVRILENGVASTVWMDENGNKVLDVYRMETTTTDNSTMSSDMNQSSTTTDATQMNAGTDMNNTETKTKVKTKNSDGTETKTKTKTKEGKTKTKTSTDPM
jgi:hypothetical protein